MRAQIKIFKPLLKRLDISAQRKLQDALGNLGAKVFSDDIVYKDEPFYNFKASWAIPMQRYPQNALLYLHGGGYTAGTLDYAKGFGTILADATEISTLFIGYRLAPENRFPCALEDAFEAYKRLLTKYEGKNIALVGESAGGGLCYALCLKIKSESLPMPGCVATISPWTDLTLNMPSLEKNKDKDPVLFKDDLEFFAQSYSAEKSADPLASPIFGNLSDLPPSLIYVGSSEILLDDSLTMAKRLEEYGCECELHEVEGMWHVFVLYGTPEAKLALKRITSFIHRHIDR